MPSYFYHLKFELYPYPTSRESDSSSAQKRRRDQGRETWIPPSGSNIFDQKWPRHKAVWTGEDSWSRGQEGKPGKREQRPREEATGTVIDCGVERATISAEDGQKITVPVANRKQFDFPIPRQENIVRDRGVAERDWRFGRVRVEGLDMDRDKLAKERGSHQPRGETSADGINAGLAAAGKVTKARFESVESKNTEVGWGIVHLYRDEKETSGLSVPPVEIYSAESGARKPAEKNGQGVEGGKENKAEDCTTLCIPAVPSYLTPSDFLGFVGEETREQVSHFRMVMTGRMNRYLVLMKFRDGNVAKNWRKEFDGKVFNSMEPETCHVVFIRSITFQTPSSSHPNTSYPELSHDPFTPASPASTFLKPFPPPTPNLVELPTCPVCLERMDDTTGLLTILCQHVFHCDCLQKWRGSGCPVCRHTNPSLAQSNPKSYPYDPADPPFGRGDGSLCSVCDCTEDLWICLICGNTGCGRYKGGHAKEHWKESAHNFALEIETQHVWDYAGDLWVHRLIQGKGDSKVIELPSSRRSGENDMEMVPRDKLENIGVEYTHLLTSQLESQRVYFEELVGKAAAKASAASASAASASSKADEAISRLHELEIENRKLKNETIPGLERDLEREKKKAEKSSELARGFGKSLMEEKRVSEGLMKRVEFVNQSLMGLSKELTKAKEENEELKESNRDLLFNISAKDKLSELAEGEGIEKGELEGGSLSLPPEKEKKGRKGKGKGKEMS